MKKGVKAFNLKRTHWLQEVTRWCLSVVYERLSRSVRHSVSTPVLILCLWWCMHALVFLHARAKICPAQRARWMQTARHPGCFVFFQLSSITDMKLILFSWGGLCSASNTERVMEVTSAGCSVLISSLLTASSKQPDRIQNSSPKMSLLSFNTDHSTTKVGLTFPNNRTARYSQPMHLVHSHSHNTTLSRRFMNVRCLKGLL